VIYLLPVRAERGECSSLSEAGAEISGDSVFVYLAEVQGLQSLLGWREVGDRFQAATVCFCGFIRTP
jgi:hypothetical protein